MPSEVSLRISEGLFFYFFFLSSRYSSRPANKSLPTATLSYKNITESLYSMLEYSEDSTCLFHTSFGVLCKGISYKYVPKPTHLYKISIDSPDSIR